MSEKKWKIVAAFLVVIIILQASLISDYKEKADEKHEERLERLLLWSIGGHFGRLARPLVFESYPYWYPITYMLNIVWIAPHILRPRAT